MIRMFFPIFVGLGIMLSSSVLAQCAATNGPGVGQGQLQASRQRNSGSAETDQLVNSYYAQLSKIFHLDCIVYYLKDIDNSYAPNDLKDRNVYLGLQLLNSTLRQPNGKVMVAFLLAHEMAHLYQYKDDKNKFYSDNNNRNSFELQADYLAGYVLCRAAIIGTNFYRDFSSISEVLKRDYSFTSPVHHGTPLQRSNAISMGMAACNLSYLSNAYENSFYYINPGSLIKPFNDKQIMGEFYLYASGRELFSKHDRIYYNENDELFFKEGSNFIKIGAGFRKQDTYSTYTFEVPYKDQVIYLTKNDYGKLLDAKGRKLGEFIFYSGFFPRGSPMTLNCYASTPVSVGESSNFSPSIAIDNGIVYVAFVDRENHITVKKSGDGERFSTLYVGNETVKNTPCLAIKKGTFYLSWVDGDGHPVISKSLDGHNWSGVFVNNVTAVDPLSAIIFRDELFIIGRNPSSHLLVIHTSDGSKVKYQALDYQTGKPPCTFIYQDDLFIGAVDIQTGLGYSIHSYDGLEFFNKQTIATISSNNPFATTVHAVPELMLSEQWYGWRSNSTGFININNNFSGTNSVEVRDKCVERPAMAFPYFAWTGTTPPYEVKVAKLIRH